MTMAGYSGTPLARKLGIKPGCRLYASHAPADYLQLLEPLPEGVHILQRPSGRLDIVHLFTCEASVLAAELVDYRQRIAEDGMIWVSWPKRSSKVPTDVTEDVIRDLALPLGLVDIKVCAVDDTWSGLKLVIRREHRKG
jgi:hypothetical protein